MKINQIATSWDRVKVSLGTGLRLQSAAQVAKPRTHEIY